LTLSWDRVTIAPVQRTCAFQRARWLGCLVAVQIAAVLLLSGCAGTDTVALTPADGSTDVPITAPVRIAFSQPMDRGSVEALFRIEPQVAGSLAWDGDEATFRPQGALAPDTSYTIALEAGALSQQGRPTDGATTSRFQTRALGLLYLGRVSAGDNHRQLFLASFDGTAPSQLTDRPLGVWDYAVHPQGEAIVYTVLRDDGGSDLWRMDRNGANQQMLLSCPDVACLNPTWSPDGRQLAYERRNIWADAPNLDPKAGRIWLLDLETGKDGPLFDYDVPANSPVWSPGGDRLAYLSPLLPGVEVYNPATADLLQFDNEWGTVPTWSPDGRQLVLPDLLMIGGDDTAASPDEATDHTDEALAVRLVRIDLESSEVLDISGDDDLIQDSAPVWSPGGGWIAVARQFLDEARWTPGRQIWLIRPDASEAYALLSEPMADHFAFAWRPDGGALAYLRTDLSAGPQAVPDVSVWVFDFAQGKPVQVAKDGVYPRWLP
jgi:Tol biopolymer transport system component